MTNHLLVGLDFATGRGVSDFRSLLLTINSICSFWQLTGIWGGGTTKISETTERMTMKFLPDVKLSKEARNQIFFDITRLVYKLQTKIPKIPIFRNATSRHANFTKLCRIVNIDIRNWSWKFQIDILKICYFTEQSVKWRQMLVCKIQNSL